MDACRAFFVLLGIVLHAALPFGSADPWIIDAPQKSMALQYLEGFLTTFRMPGFFIIAGYFAAPAIASNDPLGWLKKRGLRLGVPLAFGVLFIVPLESLAVAVALREFNTKDAWALVVQAAASRHSTFGFHWVSHLWFIFDLLLVSVVLSVIVYLFGSRRLTGAAGVIAAQIARNPVISGTVGLLGLSAYLVLVDRVSRSWLNGYLSVGGDWPMWSIVDGARIAHYLPFFVIGILLFHSRELLARFTQPSVALIFIALTFLLAKMFVPGAADTWISSALAAPAAVFLTSMWMQLGKLLTPHMGNGVRWLSRGSYTIYLVHMPFVLLAAVGTMAVELGPEVGFAVTVSVGVCLSVGTFWLLQNSPMATFLLNGRILPASVRGRGEQPPIVSAR